MSAKPSIALLLGTDIDDNDSSTHSTPLETPSVVNGAGESMVVLLPSSLGDMVMDIMHKRREKGAMEAQEERGDQEKQGGVMERAICSVTAWKLEKIRIMCWSFKHGAI